jgi:aryl-alcohol dehydrogenase-like predicted oxidoreductase
MRLRTLGGTGFKVSPYCLGALNFGRFAQTDEKENVQVINAALDAGINFIDTADFYSGGESEEILGRALKGRRDDVVLATKVHGKMGDKPNMAGNSRRWIMRAVEDSLRRLQTDYIDVYQLHRPDHSTDIEESLGALSDLVHQGKVRAVGTSTFPAEMIVEAQWTSERRNLVRFRTEQPPYSILMRGSEKSVLPTCGRYGMGVLVWGPMSGGWLAGKYQKRAEVDLTTGRRRVLPHRFDPELPGNVGKVEAVEKLMGLAAQAGISLPALALGFVMAHPQVTCAIIGPRTVEQLEDLIRCSDVALSDDVLDAIDEIVPPGTDVNRDDPAYWPREILYPDLRRRSMRTRTAAEGEPRPVQMVRP